jgi:truncated hemoglobin YjbI
VNLFEQIGAETIEKVITEFYIRAFDDIIIGHFFFGKDRLDITKKQIDFATAMLGGPRQYNGKPLETAHESLSIRPPHFGRRQVLMATVLKELNVDDEAAKGWLAMEERLRPLIFRKVVKADCNHNK